MRHVTISMEDELLREVERAAADEGVSLSDYIAGKLMPSDKPQRTPEEQAEIQRRLDMLQQVFDGPKWNISVNGRMPNAEERNSRG